MSIEGLHAWLRLGLVLWSTVCLGLLTRSLFLAYFSDYGLPRSRQRRARAAVDQTAHELAALDLDVSVFIALFALLGVLSTPNAIWAVIEPGRVELTGRSWLTMLYLVVFSVMIFRIWRKVRRERMRYAGRESSALVPTTEQDEP